MGGGGSGGGGAGVSGGAGDGGPRARPPPVSRTRAFSSRQRWGSLGAYCGASVAALGWQLDAAWEGVPARGGGGRVPTSEAALNPTFRRALAAEGLRSLSSVELALAHLLESRLSLLVVFNALVCFLVMAALVTRAVFLGRLLQHEARQALERCLHYVLYKGVFLVAAVRPNCVEMFTWCCWFALMGFFKLFSGVAKERLETLMSRPHVHTSAGSGGPGASSTHRRAVALQVFLLASVSSLTVACLSLGTYRSNPLGLALVLYEPAVVTVEVLGALSRYYLFLAEQWCLRLEQRGELGAVPAAKALWDWCGPLLYHSELFAEVATLGLTLAHYMQVWWVHGLSLQFVDAVLFLNVRAISTALHRRLAGYVRFLAATRNLRGTFPDATEDDLAGMPECAVCLEPMRWDPKAAGRVGRRAAPKKLPCGHIFHLQCLRSWLEQGGTDNYSCPICRASLAQSSGAGDAAGATGATGAAGVTGAAGATGAAEAAGPVGARGRCETSARVGPASGVSTGNAAEVCCPPLTRGRAARTAAEAAAAVSAAEAEEAGAGEPSWGGRASAALRARRSGTVIPRA